MADRPEVSLRDFQESDAPAVHRWFNNPEATKSLMEQRDSFSLEQAEGWAKRAMDQSGEDRKYAMVVGGYDEPVGFTALYGLFRQTAPELGALIGDDVRGKGVGRRAEALTIKKAFDEFGAHRVYGRIPARNEIAKKTVASQGWQYEGTMRGHLAREGEPPDDCEIWGVLPDEFRAATADLFGCADLVARPFAQLIEDGGASAGGGVGGHPSEFFRGAHFLEAEGTTHTLRIETDEAELLAPLIVRPIGDGPDLDAVSLYGYPGLSVIGENSEGVRSNGRIATESANASGGD